MKDPEAADRMEIEIMTVKDKTVCPYCGVRMLKWKAPAESSWGEGIHYICFNDDCPYYKRGWKWMKEKYEVHASYRHHYYPDTGETGPIPVWDDAALRNAIVD